jgi:hypothetical protein
VRPFSRPKTDGSGALKDAAVTALEKVTAKESDSEPNYESVLKIVPELPEMEVARISLMYYTQTYPTQEQLVAITEYLEVAYELKCQYASVDLSSGSKSWTDPDARWTVTVTLQGKKTS